MKRILSLILAVMFVVCCFAGCNTGKPEETTAPEVKDEAPALKTVEKGKLIMATNAAFAPYEYKEGEEFKGIDIEIAQAVATKLGLTLVIKDMNFDTLLNVVNEKKADIVLAGLTVTPDRQEKVDFSISYASGVQSIIVTEDSEITSVDDLLAKGSTYIAGVQLGTTGDTYATGDMGEDRVYRYVSGNEAVLSLLKGEIQCVIIDNEPAKKYLDANPGKGLKILDTSYIEEDYAAAFAKGNDELRKAVDKAIDELIADGTVDNIIKKYIK